MIKKESMKRTHLIFFALILLLFAMTALLKYTSETGIENAEAVTVKSDDRTTIRLFWDYHNRASAHLINTQYDSAAVYYKKALDLNGEHEGVLYNLGNSLLFQREYEAAEKQWLKLAEINPLSARARLQLGTLYFCMTDDNERFNPSLAETYFHEAHLLNREETGPQLKLAKIALLTDDLSKTEEHLSVVLSVNFLSYQALFLKGYLHWLADEPESAGEYHQEAASLFQNLSSTAVQGEGGTRRGARAMLSEDRFCDLFEIEIGRLLMAAQTDPETSGQLFREFHLSLEVWQKRAR